MNNLTVGSVPRDGALVHRSSDILMSKRKRPATQAAEGGGEEDDEVDEALKTHVEDEEDTEVQRRISERRTEENERLGCAEVCRSTKSPLLTCLLPFPCMAVIFMRILSAGPRQSSSSALSTGGAQSSLVQVCGD